jgi:hypothetical protein
MAYDLYNAERTEGTKYCQRFLLWPKKWKEFQWPTRLQWNQIPAKKDAVKTLPDAPGVYLFVICPQSADVTGLGIIAYVGETSGANQTLKKRCAVYFRKSEYDVRPHIGDMIKTWGGHMELRYAVVPQKDVATLEDRLLLAFAPPFNRKFPGSFNKVAKSIYSQ